MKNTIRAVIAALTTVLFISGIGTGLASTAGAGVGSISNIVYTPDEACHRVVGKDTQAALQAGFGGDVVCLNQWERDHFFRTPWGHVITPPMKTLTSYPDVWPLDWRDPMGLWHIDFFLYDRDRPGGWD